MRFLIILTLNPREHCHARVSAHGRVIEYCKTQITTKTKKKKKCRFQLPTRIIRTKGLLDVGVVLK